MEMETKAQDRCVQQPLATDTESPRILVHFRPLQQRDRQEIQKLHEEWFPVEYTDEFYDTIVENECLSGDPIYSCIAERGDEEIGEPSSSSNDAWERLAHFLHIHDFCTELQCRSESLMHRSKVEISSSHQPLVGNQTITCHNETSGQNKIVGCLIGCFFDGSKKVNKTVSMLVRNPNLHPQLFYIMTLGTTKDVRKMGLASHLVIDLLSVLERVSTCGVCYLHVITYNTAAIALYEKLGFCRVTEIQGEAKPYSFISEHFEYSGFL